MVRSFAFLLLNLPKEKFLSRQIIDALFFNPLARMRYWTKKCFNGLLKHSELMAWAIGLLFLAFSDPTAMHFTICPFHHLGLEFCPGCGLGHAVSWLLKGNWEASLACHPLGWLAVLILSRRIFTLAMVPLFNPPKNEQSKNRPHHTRSRCQ